MIYWPDLTKRYDSQYLIKPVDIFFFDFDFLHCQELIPKLIVGQSGTNHNGFFLNQLFEIQSADMQINALFESDSVNLYLKKH